MKYLSFHIVLGALLLSSSAGLNAADNSRYTPESGSPIERQKGLPWAFTPNPTLPNVLILGDSISIGYTLPVRRLLDGKANVFRPITPNGQQPINCCGTEYAMGHLDEWLAGHKWAVIYFNWGLHDLKHVESGTGTNSNNPADPVQATTQEYARNLMAIVSKLKATGARLIFATTTPVAPGTLNPLRDSGAPALYNAAAVKIMKANGIRVDDLYALCLPRLQLWQAPHNVHFKPAGWSGLAHHIAAVIKDEVSAASASQNIYSKPL